MSAPPPVVPFDAVPTAIAGLWVLTMKQIHDDRGTVREFFRASVYAEAGLPVCGPWSQMNVTETRPGAVRGIHAEAMNKLVGVVGGEAFGVYVDLRPGSATFRAVTTVALRPGVQVLVPAGVGNGFQSLGDRPTQYVYAFDDEWRPDMPGSAVSPLDPALGIEWPLPIDPDNRAHISAKDLAAPTLAELAAASGR